MIRADSPLPRFSFRATSSLVDAGKQPLVLLVDLLDSHQARGPPAGHGAASWERSPTVRYTSVSLQSW